MTNYPSGLDSIASDKTNNTLSQDDHPAHHNDLASAVVAIETALGTLPQGGSADVAARIAATETVANAALPASQKAAASGVASLDSGTLVPFAQLGTGTANGSKFLRDDRTWAVPAGSGGTVAVYNVVTGYSATGDGVTDDSTAIQNAINAAATAGGGVVYFPAGTYLIGTGLKQKANVRMVGVSRRAAVLKAGAATLTMVSQNAASTTNWTVEHLGFDFNAPATTSGMYGVNVGASGCDFVTVDSCEFKNYGSGTGTRVGVLMNAAVSNETTISNNVFTGPGAATEDNTKGVWVLFGKKFRIVGNYFNGTFRSVDMSNTASYNVSDFVVANNNVVSFGKYAILCQGVQHATVVGNVITGSNYVGGAGDSSAGVTFGIAGTQVSQYVAAVGNQCTGCEISAYDTFYGSIVGNVVKGPQAACIEVGTSLHTAVCKNITIADNYCEGSVNGSNIYLGSIADSVCSGNISVGAANYGISCTPHDTLGNARNSIIGNTCNNNQYGIVLASAAGRPMNDIQVAHNTCTGNSVQGIATSNLSDITRIRFEFNYLVGNTSGAFSIGASNTHVRKFGNITATGDYDANTFALFNV